MIGTRNLAVVLLAAALSAQAAEPARPKPAVTARIKAPDPKTAAITETLKAKKISFDFVDTPIKDVGAFLSHILGVNLILDPGIDKGKRVTLRVNDMPAGNAIGWVARISGGEMKIQDGAVYIAAVKGAKPVAPQWRAYRRPIGKAQMHLGPATVEMTLYDDDIEPETRQMLIKLLHQALAKELAKLEPKK